MTAAGLLVADKSNKGQAYPTTEGASESPWRVQVKVWSGLGGWGFEGFL